MDILAWRLVVITMTIGGMIGYQPVYKQSYIHHEVWKFFSNVRDKA